MPDAFVVHLEDDRAAQIGRLAGLEDRFVADDALAARVVEIVHAVVVVEVEQHELFFEHLDPLLRRHPGVAGGMPQVGVSRIG